MYIVRLGIGKVKWVRRYAYYITMKSRSEGGREVQDGMYKGWKYISERGGLGGVLIKISS
jgi:hypothetical protein